MRATNFAIAAVMLAVTAGQVEAGPIYYTVEFSGATLRDYNGDDLNEVFGGSFTLHTAAPITSPGLFSIDSGMLSANAAALYHLDSVQEFDPNGFSTGKNFIGVRIVNNDNSGSGTGFLFFEAGSFLSDGVYSAFTGTITDGNGFYGNFASDATLTVRGISDGSTVPEPTSLALAGFAGLGMAAGAWRRRRQQQQAA